MEPVTFLVLRCCKSALQLRVCEEQNVKIAVSHTAHASMRLMTLLLSCDAW